jgi:hypothetical protein
VAKLHELQFIKSKRVLLILGEREREREREIDFVCGGVGDPKSRS